MIILLLTSCGSENESQTSRASDDSKTDYPETKAFTKEEVLHSSFENDEDGSIVYLSLSTANDGYIGVCLKQDYPEKIKLRIVKDDNTYTYDVNSTEMTAYPLQMGDGTYLLKVLQNIEGDQYAVIYTREIDVTLSDENIVYMYPNQVVNYDNSDMVIGTSFEVTSEDTNDLDRAYDLYKYVMDVLDYDNDKAKNVTTVYTLPDLEDALNRGKGICFDYASLLAALCRCQHIPARVIVGYTDIEYHAWVEIYLENEGWINPKFFFEGEEWSLVDPTFDDSGSDYEGAYDEVYRY